ncbi:MAG TPA: archaemetzincin [Urbifossiella sp.]|nr:archaemetzincin [Urbifossiella sp.]
MPPDRVPCENTYPEIEDRLGHLTDPLPAPRPGDWRAEHREKGQTFRQYLAANPVRRDAERATIYLCRVGEFDGPQQAVADRTAEYLGLVFDTPVVTRRRVPTAELPARAKRKHPDSGGRQLLAPYLLHEVLVPDRPDDALAYLALTARDLWPGDGWNFVFGQADLRQRVGVCSLYRNGYPGPGEDRYRLCLRRTLMTAAHETGHVLTLPHCTAHPCLMNGSNHLAERDAQPSHPCPVCLRKLCWNLQVEPAPYLLRLAAFHRDHGLGGAEWLVGAATALDGASLDPSPEHRSG